MDSLQDLGLDKCRRIENIIKKVDKDKILLENGVTSLDAFKGLLKAFGHDTGEMVHVGDWALQYHYSRKKMDGVDVYYIYEDSGREQTAIENLASRLFIPAGSIIYTGKDLFFSIYIAEVEGIFKYVTFDLRYFLKICYVYKTGMIEQEDNVVSWHNVHRDIAKVLDLEGVFVADYIGYGNVKEMHYNFKGVEEQVFVDKFYLHSYFDYLLYNVIFSDIDKLRSVSSKGVTQGEKVDLAYRYALKGVVDNLLDVMNGYAEDRAFRDALSKIMSNVDNQVTKEKFLSMYRLAGNHKYNHKVIVG